MLFTSYDSLHRYTGWWQTRFSTEKYTNTVAQSRYNTRADQCQQLNSHQAQVIVS
jgi:hypothetical protein